MRQVNNTAFAEYENNLIKSVLSSIERYGGKDCLSSVILTGSFGRDEPTYEIQENQIHLKSDVEIALIFPDSKKKELVSKLIQNVAAEYNEDLNLMAVAEKRVRKAYNFNFSLRVPKYKTIFTYDLFNGSKTIWGQDFIFSKKVALDDVDIYEAKRLVANRIAELIYLQNHTKDSTQKENLRIQWKGKLMLAIASAWLICENEYVSSYHGQYKIMKERITDTGNLLGKDFFDEYDKVFCFLRENGSAYEVSDNKLIGYVKRMDYYFRKLKIRKPRVNSISRVLKYTIKYVKTGMRYGMVGFENNILQALIFHYWNQSEEVVTDAEVWHKVLY